MLDLHRLTPIAAKNDEFIHLNRLLSSTLRRLRHSSADTIRTIIKPDSSTTTSHGAPSVTQKQVRRKVKTKRKDCRAVRLPVSSTYSSVQDKKICTMLNRSERYRKPFNPTTMPTSRVLEHARDPSHLPESKHNKSPHALPRPPSRPRHENEM